MPNRRLRISVASQEGTFLMGWALGNARLARVHRRDVFCQLALQIPLFTCLMSRCLSMYRLKGCLSGKNFWSAKYGLGTSYSYTGSLISANYGHSLNISKYSYKLHILFLQLTQHFVIELCQGLVPVGLVKGKTSWCQLILMLAIKVQRAKATFLQIIVILHIQHVFAQIQTRHLLVKHKYHALISHTFWWKRW